MVTGDGPDNGGHDEANHGTPANRGKYTPDTITADTDCDTAVTSHLKCLPRQQQRLLQGYTR
jgi:hypothetical protein